MSREFGEILQGLMDNRRLTPRAVSRVTARAEATIKQLLNGKVPPSIELLQDIAPVLQMDLADLCVIAGIPATPTPDRPKPYVAAMEIADLVAAASFLSTEQVADLVERARNARDDNPST